MLYSIYNENCFDWMASREENSITAIVTDPPYGVKEYTEKEIEKQRAGKGGIWRIPPSFDGHQRQAVPRFSVINDDPKERENVYSFFHKWAELAIKILVPGGHVFIASTPLLSDILSKAMRDAGFERRGEVIRTVATLRGGDRPKGAETEYANILKRMGIYTSSICPLMFMNNPLCKSMPVITSSNKLRTYSSARFYPEAEILRMITGLNQ